jgi:CysZ protein
MLAAILPSAYAALRQVLSPELRSLFWRTLGLTLLLLGLLWYGLTQLLSYLVTAYPVSTDYPFVNAALVFLAGAGCSSACSSSCRSRPLSWPGSSSTKPPRSSSGPTSRETTPGSRSRCPHRSAMGLRFAGLALAVNVLAVLLILIPGVNILAFFAANAYLLSREYFEMAAGRFRPMADASRLRREHRGIVLAGGAVLAGLVLIPVVNLIIPLFGIAFMVHLHKRIARRRIPAL